MIAIVTGASRGAGRGIALELGLEHAPGTIDDTAAEVTRLGGDPRIMEKSGGVYPVGDLATEYGFTDVDGRMVPAFELPIE